MHRGIVEALMILGFLVLFIVILNWWMGDYNREVVDYGSGSNVVYGFCSYNYDNSTGLLFVSVRSSYTGLPFKLFVNNGSVFYFGEYNSELVTVKTSNVESVFIIGNNNTTFVCVDKTR